MADKYMERSDIKRGVKGGISHLQDRYGDSHIGILLYNPSCGEAVKFNYDCNGDDGSTFNYEGWIVAG